jgi:hypothetical protein
LAPCVDPSIELDPQFRSSVGYSYYSTGWNLLILNRAIVGRWEGDCPTQFVTRVRFD